jgi:uncharacterized protein
MAEFQTTGRFADRGGPAGHSSRFHLFLLPRFVLCFGIQVYRRVFSPAQVYLFGAQGGCRFTPTCSQYAMDAIREHGALAGGMLAVKRICRCQPFGECGHDPVPKAAALSRTEKPLHTC